MLYKIICQVDDYIMCVIIIFLDLDLDKTKTMAI